MRHFSAVILCSVFAVLFASCSGDVKVVEYTGFTEQVDSILHDTVIQSVYVDSMRTEAHE